MKPTKMLDGIIKYDVLIEYEPEEIKVWGARFLRDFGPWKADTRVEFLFVDYELGRMVELDRHDQELRSCNLELICATTKAPSGQEQRTKWMGVGQSKIQTTGQEATSKGQNDGEELKGQ